MGNATLILGDCLDVLRTLPDASVDAVVADPPGGLRFMGKSWDSDRGGRDRWVAWLAERLAESLRVAKPGSRLLCWAIPRTSHWTGCAIEDAGWHIEDSVLHLFGTGFPKAKSKLKPAHEVWWLARKPGPIAELQIDACRIGYQSEADFKATYQGVEAMAASPERSKPGANKHGGWQRPWMETKSIVDIASVNPAGRWPANVCLSHHESCERVGTRRVKGSNGVRGASTRIYGGGAGNTGATGEVVGYADPDGLETVDDWRCVEGCPIRQLDEQSGVQRSGVAGKRNGVTHSSNYGLGPLDEPWGGYGDSGGASRFFFCAKASRSDRGEGNTHPTVKSTKLMDWLIRLITPPGGVVLDPFAGSGSTGVAAVRGGFGFVGIEDDSEPGSFATAERRIREAGPEDFAAPRPPDEDRPRREERPGQLSLFDVA